MITPCKGTFQKSKLPQASCGIAQNQGSLELHLVIIIKGGAVPPGMGHYHSVGQRRQGVPNDCHLHCIAGRQVPEHP